MTADIAKLKAQNVVKETFEYYLSEAENGWCKIPRRVADDMSLGYASLMTRIEELEKERDDALAKYRKELGERLIGEVAVEANLRAELHAAWKRMEDLTRTIAARDRRIGRLVWAMDYAREKGVKFPADDEPPIVHGDQS